jgi:TetR/AcrR family transcriptional regulator, lmrAB and yxaGH operons repressor
MRTDDPQPRATRSDSKDAFIAATQKLLRRQGYAATGLADIIRESQAPKGSLYFHFPEGKEELAVTAMTSAGMQLGGLIRRILDAGETPLDGLEDLIAAMAAALEASGYLDGCPIATVTLEAAAGSPAIRHTASTAFGVWTAEIARALERDGLEPAAAKRRATLVLAVIEGALILSRAEQSTAPLMSVREELRELLS